MRPPRLGTTPNHRAHLGHPQLGNGVQEVLPGHEGPDILRQPEGAQREACRVVNGECVASVHHELPDRARRPAHLPSQVMVLHDPGRGAQYQELQESTMADFARVQGAEEVVAHRHAAAEQLDGAVESAVLPHAAWCCGGGDRCSRVCEPQGLHGVVLK